MATVHMTFTDTPTGGVEVHTDFTPTVGAACSKAQAVALEIFNRTRRDWQLAGTDDGGITTTSARIKREAAHAAQCYTDVLSACPYPLSSEAGKMFQLHFQVALDLKKSAHQEAAA